jgi:DNA-binding transcriptional ArsR family regulator
VARPRASQDSYRAIADPTRRRIIDLLSERSMTAGQIAAAFDSCQSTVSEHLGILRRAGLVTYVEQTGRRIYSLQAAPLAEIAAWAARHTAPES